MKRKAKGFTILEVIIALVITTIILGAIYSFFFTNNRSFSTTDIKSTLQSEGEAIQSELLFYGTQASGIQAIDGEEPDDASNKYSELSSISDYKRDINSVEFKFSDEKVAKFELNSGILKIYILSGESVVEEKVLSKNVKEFKIKPTDINIVNDKNLADFSTTPGLEVTYTLQKKKGYSDVEYKIRAVVKFRNN